jgi:cytochrome c553
MRSTFGLSLIWLGFIPTCACFADDAAVPTRDQNAGERVYLSECAKCHGAAGQGGKSGEYPRLAGLPAGYIAQQLRAFRDRKRRNKPMIPIFKAGLLQDAQIDSVAVYLAGMPTPSSSDVDVSMQPPRDLEFGEELYVTDCALCHGHDGRGKEDTDNPPVVRQFPRYLIKQMVDFRNGKRSHEHGEQLFEEAEPEELDAILGYILYLNHNPPAPQSGDSSGGTSPANVKDEAGS